MVPSHSSTILVNGMQAEARVCEQANPALVKQLKAIQDASVGCTTQGTRAQSASVPSGLNIPQISLAANPYFFITRGGRRKVGSSRICKSHTLQSTRYWVFIKNIDYKQCRQIILSNERQMTTRGWETSSCRLSLRITGSTALDATVTLSLLWYNKCRCHHNCCCDLRQQLSHWSVQGVEFTHSARRYFSSVPVCDDKVGANYPHIYVPFGQHSIVIDHYWLTYRSRCLHRRLQPW